MEDNDKGELYYKTICSRCGKIFTYHSEVDGDTKQEVIENATEIVTKLVDELCPQCEAKKAPFTNP